MTVHIERAALSGRTGGEQESPGPPDAEEHVMTLIAIVAMIVWWGAILVVALEVLRRGLA